MINLWILIIVFIFILYILPISIIVALVYFVKDTKLRVLLVVAGLLVLAIPFAHRKYRQFIEPPKKRG